MANHTLEFRIDAGDRNAGTLYLPHPRARDLPVLILCHDWGADRRLSPFTSMLCVRAVEHGIAVVTFDLFGCGETGGDFRQMTYGRWAANLHDVCRYVEEQRWARVGSIGALGVSSGSVAALRCALDHYPLAFVISVATILGPYIRMPDGPATVLSAHFERLQAGGTVSLYGVEFGLSFILDFLGMAPIYRLQAIRCPVLFLQGGADKAVRRGDALLGYEVLREHGLPTAHLVMPGGDHTLDLVPTEASTAAVEWLRSIGVGLPSV